jgi:hypothetical protein
MSDKKYAIFQVMGGLGKNIAATAVAQVIKKAYLYWAGSGTGDFNVKLNNLDVTALRTFSKNHTSNNQ